ncbi:MAG: hypothetical protein FJ137_08085 [Deltaproteobacteria bacterium]|nr:hypothetical protein [Deltaproteobacteria bacterium]
MSPPGATKRCSRSRAVERKAVHSVVDAVPAGVAQQRVEATRDLGSVTEQVVVGFGVGRRVRAERGLLDVAQAVKVDARIANAVAVVSPLPTSIVASAVQGELDAVRAHLAEVRAERDELKAQRTRLQADVDELRRLLEDSRQRVAALERELNGGVRGLLQRTFRR